jgi:glucokinase
MAEELLAAVDIGGTKITASVSSRRGVLARVYQATRKRGDDRTIPRQVQFLLGEACRGAGLHRRGITAVGISTCSPFEKKGEHLLVAAPNICGGLARQRGLLPNDWTGIPLQEELTGRYPTLRIGNDAITAAVAERLFGAGRGEDNLIYVTWSTGIGGGAFVDGHLLTGKHSNAMHLGHIVMNWDYEGQPQCGCGGWAHLEALAAGPAIEREYGAPPKEVFQRYRAGEPKAAEVVRRVATIFARGLHSAVCLLDSRLIIVGGSVAKNWDVLEPLVSAEFHSTFTPLTGGVLFKRSELDEYLGDLAGLSLVMPEAWIEQWQGQRPWERAPAMAVLPDDAGEGEGDG